VDQPFSTITATMTARETSQSHGPIVLAHGWPSIGGLYSASSIANAAPINGQSRKRASNRPRSDPPMTSAMARAIAAGATRPNTVGRNYCQYPEADPPRIIPTIDTLNSAIRARRGIRSHQASRNRITT
jgi:hypothetical protein